LDHHKDAGGAIIRKGLQQLESAGYITKKNKGRLMTDEGMKKIDRLATEIHNEIIKAAPDLQRYA
jgi:small subunit ribosomal protein S19e